MYVCVIPFLNILPSASTGQHRGRVLLHAARDTALELLLQRCDLLEVLRLLRLEVLQLPLQPGQGLQILSKHTQPTIHHSGSSFVSRKGRCHQDHHHTLSTEQIQYDVVRIPRA
jgi:hypothetical protein